MDLELEVARELSERRLFDTSLEGQRAPAMPTGNASRPCSSFQPCWSCPQLPPRRPPLHSPSPGPSQSSAHLSHSGVGITDLAQICLSTQQGGQLGLGQQVLQVVGSSDFQLG